VSTPTNQTLICPSCGAHSTTPSADKFFLFECGSGFLTESSEFVGQTVGCLSKHVGRLEERVAQLENALMAREVS